MNRLVCPVDQTNLVLSKTAGEESSKCPECDGVWLTLETLETLEAKAANADMVKGQRQYGKHEVDHDCPHCAKNMIRFRYRGYNLEIESCPTDAGFWLDKNEEREIRDVMKKRASNLARASSAEQSWHNARRGVKISLLQRIKQLFGIN